MMTDKDAQRRPWCMFGDADGMRRLGRLVYAGSGSGVDYGVVIYISHNGEVWSHCRECTPEELALHGLTQPPRPWSDRVTQWAIDRNIIGGTTAKDQFGKLKEEVEELRDAIYSDNIRETIDAIGDCSVVLTVIAAQYGLTLEQCQEAAWEEIKDRKGRLVNGTFVKEVSE
jgi:NTP pyrophosphatase (non-canonical NTP hydrolase)